MSNLSPAVGLFLLSPVLGEVVSGYLAPLEFLNPLRFVITVVPYGCGALLVRESIVRRRKGWLSLVLLALAFGLFFEGIVTRVLFNPNWEELGALGEYTHVFGFSWTLAVGIVHFQAAISIICAILLAEMIWPAQCHESWIGTRALIGCGIALPGWALVIGALIGYSPPLIGALVLIGLVVGLVVLALVVPAELPAPSRRPPSPAVFWAMGAAGMTLNMVGTYIVPNYDFRPPMVVMFVALLGLMIAEFGLLARLNQGGAAWKDRHRLALVVGFLTFFLAFSILQDLEAFAGRSLVSLTTLWLLWRLWLRIGALKVS